MKQITGAIIRITLVLSAVFVPMAFFPGAVGVIYRQFSLTMVVSILFSAFLALSLTPALCATFLKPIPEEHHEKKGLLRLVQSGLSTALRVAIKTVGRIIRRTGTLHGHLPALTGSPAGPTCSCHVLLPNEDQGYLIADMQAPAEAGSSRLQEVIRQVEKSSGPRKPLTGRS